MCPCAGSCENQLPFIYGIDEKPIRLHMTLAKSCVISGQSMVAMFCGKKLFPQKRLQDFVQFSKIVTAFADAP